MLTTQINIVNRDTVHKHRVSERFCLAPVMRAQTQMPGGRIFMQALVNKIFSQREDMPVKNFDAPKPPQYYYDNLERYLGKRRLIGQYPGQMSRGSEYTAEIMDNCINGVRPAQSAEEFAERYAQDAQRHLEARARERISLRCKSWGYTPEPYDAELTAFHISLLILMRQSAPELFESDESFFGMLEEVTRTAHVYFDEDNGYVYKDIAVFPFQYRQTFLATVYTTDRLYFNIACDLIMQLTGRLDESDKQFAYSLVQKVYNKDGLPDIGSGFEIDSKLDFRTKSLFAPESGYVSDVLNFFENCRDGNKDVSNTELINGFLATTVPGTDMTVPQAAYNHLQNRREQGSEDDHYLFPQTMELTAYNVSVLIVLRNHVPELFMRPDGTDIFADILRQIFSDTEVIYKNDNATANFRYGDKALQEAIMEVYFYMGHEIGHNIFGLNKNIFEKGDGRTARPLWNMSAQELFADLTGLVLWQILGKRVSNIDELPNRRKNDIQDSLNQSVYDEPHTFSSNQIRHILGDPFLRSDMRARLNELINAVRMSVFDVMPQTRQYVLPKQKGHFFADTPLEALSPTEFYIESSS